MKQSKSLGVLQLVAAQVIRPDHRQNSQLTFPPAKREAITELTRWMQKGSSIPFVDGLAGKDRPIERDNAESYFAREIMSTGLNLAAFRAEIDPNPFVF